MEIKLYSNPIQQLDPVFVANIRGIMKSRHPRFRENFVPVFVGWSRSSYYSWLDFEETDFVQLTQPPPCLLYNVQFPPLLEPAGGRSEREWAKIALFLGRARVSKLCTRGKSYNLFDQERQKIFATTSVGRHWSESGDMSGPVCSCTSQPALRRFYPRQISAQKLSVVCTAFLCLCFFLHFSFFPMKKYFCPSNISTKLLNIFYIFCKWFLPSSFLHISSHKVSGNISKFL